MASATYSEVKTQENLVPGSWLTSESSRYQILNILGEGSFGMVAKCLRMSDKKTVAIKVMKDDDSQSLKDEVTVLRKLSMYDCNKYNLVEWYQVFMDQGRACLEFEHLDKSLYDFMEERRFGPLSLKEIRPIVAQMAVALDHLRNVGIIHTDLKLENIMLVNHQQEPFRIKVIDFGGALETSDAKAGFYIQSLPYRSPETILGLPVTEAVDIWSLGCITAALYLGYLLYPGNSEYDMMKYIVETQGQPPTKMLNSGLNTSSFFYKNSTTTKWKLKRPAQVFQESGIQFTEEREAKFTSLDELLHVQQTRQRKYANEAAEMYDRLMFVELLKEMLELDPEKRITPRGLLEHPFINLSHMERLKNLNSYVKSSYDLMKICKRKSEVSSDSRRGVSGSLQQPVSETTQPPQQRFSSPCSWELNPNDPNDPSSMTTTPSQQNDPPPSSQRRSRNSSRPSHCEAAPKVPVKAKFKRKSCDEDMQDTSQTAKRRRTDSKDVGEKIPPSSKYERSDHDKRKFQDSPGPSCSTDRTPSSIAGNKRKMDHDKTEFSCPRKRTRKGHEDSWSGATDGAQNDPNPRQGEDPRCREARGKGAKRNLFFSALSYLCSLFSFPSPPNRSRQMTAPS